MLKKNFDYSKLCGKIKEKYGTQEKFSKELGISPTWLSSKLNNKVEFSQQEMALSCWLLGLKKENIPDYFFKEKVKKNLTKAV